MGTVPAQGSNKIMYLRPYSKSGRLNYIMLAKHGHGQAIVSKCKIKQLETVTNNIVRKRRATYDYVQTLHDNYCMLTITSNQRVSSTLLRK